MFCFCLKTLQMPTKDDGSLRRKGGTTGGKVLVLKSCKMGHANESGVWEKTYTITFPFLLNSAGYWLKCVGYSWNKRPV